MTPEQTALSLDHVLLQLEVAIEQGAWTECSGICGHCYDVGTVYLADPDLMEVFNGPTDPMLICKECIVHRSLWTTYLDTYP